MFNVKNQCEYCQWRCEKIYTECCHCSLYNIEVLRQTAWLFPDCQKPGGGHRVDSLPQTRWSVQSRAARSCVRDCDCSKLVQRVALFCEVPPDISQWQWRPSMFIINIHFVSGGPILHNILYNFFQNYFFPSEDLATNIPPQQPRDASDRWMMTTK